MKIGSASWIAPIFFAVLAIAFVWRGLLPGQALLPIDNLFLFPPWQAHAGEYGAELPHNPLISDAILQNYSWKRFIAESYAAGQFPLWNPYILSGQPFLAAGQNGALYPLGALYFVLPLPQAYGWFIALHLWIGAIGAYWLARTLGASRLGGLISGITFGFCGYLVVSFLWPMVVSTAVWLPMLLAVIERGVRGARLPALIAVGAVIVALQFLAGHLEMSLYLLLTAGLYTGFRLLGELWTRRWRRAAASGLAALAMVGLGTALAAVLLVPFVEAIGANVRSGWADYEETIGYAHTRDRAIAFLVPDYFGNPSHHTYLDLFDGEVRSVEHTRANGERRLDTEWGGKNYVEGTLYLGILPLLLAAVALTARPGAGGWTLAAIALLSLLFAFGTPAYALLFYAIPGVNQLHTPFRWVYPFGLCVAILAGLGITALTGDEHQARVKRWAAGIGFGAVAAGALALVVLLVIAIFRDPAAGLAQRTLGRFPDMRAGFGDAWMLLSYQYWNLLGSALLVTAAGLMLVLAARRRSRLIGLIGVALLVGDLFSFGVGFNSVEETSGLGLVPPSIRAIQEDPELFRVVTYGEDDTLPSNTNMLFGLQDIRGYDTIILRDYVDYLNLVEPQRGIAFSKVAKLFDQRSLSSPLLDLLTVKYVFTSKTVTQPGWTLVHESDGVRVYQNRNVLPRAFVVGGVEPVGDKETALRLVGDPAFNPSRTVVVENWGGERRAPGGPPRPAEMLEYGGNRVVVRADAPEGGFLVLGDVFFTGWAASVDGVTRPLLRANGLVRAVELTPGTHDVTFEYRPLSFRLGGFISFLGTVGLTALFGVAVWTRLGRRVEPTTASQRVLKNSAFPMATSLLNKTVDVAFALVMFRVLQAEGVGAYTFAGVLVGYVDILVGFGLPTLLTREVARERAAAGRYLGNSLAVRLLLWLVCVAVVAVLAGPASGALGITPPIALTIWLLLLGALPAILSSGLTALFQAHERMEYPAAVTILTTLVKVSLGLVALFGGWGYVGLAAVSVVGNVVTAVVLVGLYWTTIGWPRLEVDWRFSRSMVNVSVPLMVNSLLNSIFFRIDAVLLKPMAGDVALGWYSTAYKFIDGLQIIPASFVLAVFPLMSRHAEGDRVRLARIVTVSLKGLLILALPISVGTTLLAEPIILVFAGQSFLPQAATALQILIWFLPLSFVNGLVQYVLISVNRQRWITLSFLIGAGFNLGANLMLIPSYGYLAASAVTVLSEVVLLVPFWRVVRQELPPIDLLGLTWRPGLAALVMALPVWAMRDWSAILAIPVAALVYGGGLLVLRTFDAEDRAILQGLVRRQSEPRP